MLFSVLKTSVAKVRNLLISIVVVRNLPQQLNSIFL